MARASRTRVFIEARSPAPFEIAVNAGRVLAQQSHGFEPLGELARRVERPLELLPASHGVSARQQHAPQVKMRRGIFGRALDRGFQQAAGPRVLPGQVLHPPQRVEELRIGGSVPAEQGQRLEEATVERGIGLRGEEHRQAVPREVEVRPAREERLVGLDRLPRLADGGLDLPEHHLEVGGLREAGDAVPGHLERLRHAVDPERVVGEVLVGNRGVRLQLQATAQGGLGPDRIASLDVGPGRDVAGHGELRVAAGERHQPTCRVGGAAASGPDTPERGDQDGGPWRDLQGSRELPLGLLEIAAMKREQPGQERPEGGPRELGQSEIDDALGLRPLLPLEVTLEGLPDLAHPTGPVLAAPRSEAAPVNLGIRTESARGCRRWPQRVVGGDRQVRQ